MNGTEKSTPSSSSSPSPVITLPTAFEFEPAFEPAFEDPAGGSLPPFTCPKQYPSGPSTPPSAAASVFSTSFMKDRNAKGFGHTRTRTEGSCTRRGGDDEEEAATADDDAALSSPFARASDFFARDASSSESESESERPAPAPGAWPLPRTPSPTPRSRSHSTPYFRSRARFIATWSSQLPSAQLARACLSRVCAPGVARKPTEPMQLTNPHASNASGG